MMPSITFPTKENFNDLQLGTCWNGNLIEIKTVKNSLHIQKQSYIEGNGAQNLFMWSANKILEQLKIKFNWEKKTPFYYIYDTREKIFLAVSFGQFPKVQCKQINIKNTAFLYQTHRKHQEGENCTNGYEVKASHWIWEDEFLLSQTNWYKGTQ